MLVNDVENLVVGLVMAPTGAGRKSGSYPGRSNRPISDAATRRASAPLRTGTSSSTSYFADPALISA
jgi:hypothetical protein